MACPACHRPLEGEDEYVCCATAQLQWRCQDCGKVSQGLAFPYGTCPACGGKLALLDERRVEEVAALEAIRIAFEIELGGQAFYTRASKEAADPALRALFGRFSDMAKEHMATLSRRYHAQVPAPSLDFKVDRAAIYAGIPNRPEDPANLFRIAIAFEQRAVKFFEGRVGVTPEGSPERQLYLELAAEEREHVDRLVTELERWKAGLPGSASGDAAASSTIRATRPVGKTGSSPCRLTIGSYSRFLTTSATRSVPDASPGSVMATATPVPATAAATSSASVATTTASA